MDKVTKTEDSSILDKGLIAMFIKLSRRNVQANNNAIRAILELRHAFQRGKTGEQGIKP